MPFNLGNYILRRHQSNPGRLFFGDPEDQDGFVADYGVPAIEAVYVDLVARGIVQRGGPIVSNRGVPVPMYRITQAGRDAEVGPDYDPD
jgi:hypothetical protein